MSALPSFLVGALAVQMRAEIGFGLRSIGTLVAIFFFVAAMLSTPAGRLAEGIGAGRGMRIAGFVAAVALVTGALAPSLPVLVLAMTICGAAGALGQVSANLSIATVVDETRQAFAFGIKQAGVPAATLLGGLAVPAFALTIGWRWAWAAGAVLAVATALSVPRTRSRLSGRPRLRRSASVTTVPLVVLAGAAALGAAAANSFGAYLVDSAVTAGVAEAGAGFLYAAGSAMGLLTRVFIGWAADRRQSGRLLWVAAQLAGGAVGFGLLATGATELVIPATILCFAGGWGWPGLFNFAIVHRHRAAPAAATGVSQTGVYMGGVAGPPLFGYVAESFSYGAAWVGAAAFALVASAGIVFGRHLLLRAGTRPEEADDLLT